MIEVKFIELGSPIQEIALEDGATVSDLFNAVGETFVEGSVTRRNNIVRSYDRLYSGDRIFNGKSTKGNLEPFEVSFVKLGDSTTNFPAEDGYTIKQVLEQASPDERARFFRPNGESAYEYRVGGNRVDENFVLHRPVGSNIVKVVCSQRVKGN